MDVHIKCLKYNFLVISIHFVTYEKSVTRGDSSMTDAD